MLVSLYFQAIFVHGIMYEGLYVLKLRFLLGQFLFVIMSYFVSPICAHYMCGVVILFYIIFLI